MNPTEIMITDLDKRIRTLSNRIVDSEYREHELNVRIFDLEQKIKRLENQ